ncbi:hypothetical protein [Achromobacter xylosoxidans]|uniref:hypothetical protein n=1 Tax=Alcaligenes xylosoxydans xylosoxydans TaxID=85698 RepID=UPI001237232B|nr:hypothetical protein [Achromobacter xylosoxidans]
MRPILSPFAIVEFPGHIECLQIMITNVPNKPDYESAGIARLNLAWEAVHSLLDLIALADMTSWDDDGSAATNFWAASQQSLGNAHALIHQGIELLLKGHIAAVSPYLLLDRNIRDWPTRRPDWTADFSEFRTVDSADLVKLFNTVCSTPLPEPFATMIEMHRKARNAFIHSIGSSKAHDAVGLWKVILEVVHELVAPQKWFELRRAYLDADAAVIAFGSDHLITSLARESEILVRQLNTGEKEKYLGWNRKARAYICYHCASDYPDAEIRPETAQLAPNAPDSTLVTCFTCGQPSTVHRTQCVEPECKGNVIEAQHNICLTCFSEQMDHE